MTPETRLLVMTAKKVLAYCKDLPSDNKPSPIDELEFALMGFNEFESDGYVCRCGKGTQSAKMAILHVFKHLLDEKQPESPWALWRCDRCHWVNYGHGTECVGCVIKSEANND